MITLRDIKKKVWGTDFSIFSLFDKDRDKIHPAELAHVIDILPFDNALLSFSELPYNTQVKVFAYVNISVQHKLIKSLSQQRAAFILNNLSSDDRLSFLGKLSALERSKYINFLDEKNKDATEDFLGYPDNSVARLIDTDFATISKDMTVAEASAHLREFHKDNEAANVIYVVDEQGKLIDDIQVRRFVLNHPEKKISEIMDGNFVTLNINDTKETAIDKFKEYDRVVMPVVNNDNVLLGVITIDDVMDIAEQKNTAEIQKFGGVEELDYPYVKTPFFSLIKKRAGWLVVLFLGEMFTATAMGYFDNEISKAVVLALFIPLIISSGGNSGSQAATLVIRAMALKELTVKDWWYVMRREIFSGLSLGVILGSIGFLRILIWQNLHWYDYGEHWLLVAITIFLSLIGIVMWGTLSGSMIPIALKKVKIDPATSSAPFVATLVDVTGLVIYFSIAAVVLKGTLL